MLFYGQIDSSKEIVDMETTFAQVFSEAESLLISEGKAIDVGNDQFTLVNHEDIISGMHVANVYKHDEKDALGLLTKIGKAFKNQFQSEIDEFNPETCDINETFGSFSGALVAILNEFYTQKESKDANKTAKLVPKEMPRDETPTEANLGAEENAASTALRFPGGMVEPEQLDEMLFHEFEQLSSIYNVEMVDGVISRNKIYLFSTAIDIDYSEFPQCPKIKIPSNVANVLSMSQKYQNWNAEDPPRIIDLISEIEQLFGSFQPSGPSQADRAAEVNEFIDNLGYDETEKRKELKERKMASSTLADRLLSKEKKESKQKPTKPTVDFTSNEGFNIEENSLEAGLEISEEADELASKTPLKEVLKKEKTDEASFAEMTQSIPASPPAKPVKFVIKPKFVVDGTEVELKQVKQPPARSTVQSKVESKHPASSSKPLPKSSGASSPPATSKPASRSASQAKTETKAKSATGAIKDAINTPAKPGPSPAKKFDIPAVHELDSFVPKTIVKKPELKAPAVQSRHETKPVQKPAKQPAVVKPSPVEKKPVPQVKPRTKSKDDGVMPGWDDGGEIEMRKARDIDDFDIPIKKIDSKKNGSPDDEGTDDSS